MDKILIASEDRMGALTVDSIQSIIGGAIRVEDWTNLVVMSRSRESPHCCDNR